MLDPGKAERVEEFLRKSLLGEELINTQFHLFSARSLPSGRVIKPRVLCANNVLLAKSSKYFLDLLSSDVNPSDPSLIDLTDDNDFPANARIDDYGYGSDSDLDDCNDPIPEESKVHPTTPRSKINFATAQPQNNDEFSDDDSESVSSDMFVMSPEHPTMDDLFPGNKDGGHSVASSETAVHENPSNKTPANQAAMRLRSLGSRHVLVRDTAFRTWYTLLNYLYTGKYNFLPLSSATPNGQPPNSSTNFPDEPRCSAKSMYRLACKVELDHLRDEAFSYIQSNLTENNILKEISCSLVSRHPQLLEMELDVLYSYIASPPVSVDFPALAQRIANKELSHGAGIIVGIHTRLLKEPHPLPLRPTRHVTFSDDLEIQEPTAEVTLTSPSNPPEAEAEDERTPPPADMGITLSGFLQQPSRSIRTTTPGKPQKKMKGKGKLAPPPTAASISVSPRPPSPPVELGEQSDDNRVTTGPQLWHQCDAPADTVQVTFDTSPMNAKSWFS